MKTVTDEGNHITLRFLGSWIQVLLPWESEAASVSEEKESSGILKVRGKHAWQSCHKICAGDILLPARLIHPSGGG